MMALLYALELYMRGGTPVRFPLSSPPYVPKNISTNFTQAIIEPLLAGTKAKLLECGVKESNIVVQSVPGSWELPIACSK